MSEGGEFQRIRHYFAPLAKGFHGAKGLLDDAAELSLPPHAQLIISQDTLVEGVHFFGHEMPQAIAQKALRVNISDLAAKGAVPYAYMLALSLPPARGEDWLQAFAEGLAQDQQHFGLHLMGGDSTSTPSHIHITITAFGLGNRMVERSGAKVGDSVYVSGNIGQASLDCARIREGKQVAANSPYYLPMPRIELAPLLQAHATSAMDISDGLLQDATHICRASSAGLVLELSHIPFAETGDTAHLLLQATGGDDYEVLFTLPETQEAAFRDKAKHLPFPVTRIGTVTEGHGLSLLHHGKALPLPEKLGFQHS